MTQSDQSNEASISAEPEESTEPNQQRPEILVFSTLALLGGGLLALISLTDIDWFFPTLFYGSVAYFAWQRYF